MSLLTRSSSKVEKQTRVVGEDEVQVVYIAGKQNYGRVADVYREGPGKQNNGWTTDVIEGRIKQHCGREFVPEN
jgi:hypothetical protein